MTDLGPQISCYPRARKRSLNLKSYCSICPALLPASMVLSYKWSSMQILFNTLQLVPSQEAGERERNLLRTPAADFSRKMA